MAGLGLLRLEGGWVLGASFLSALSGGKCVPHLFIYFFGEILLAKGLGHCETSLIHTNPKQCVCTKLATKLLTMSKQSPPANPYHQSHLEESSHSDETYDSNDKSYDNKPTTAIKTSKP